jgi:CRP-like cAMP-binding protein
MDDADDEKTFRSGALLSALDPADRDALLALGRRRVFESGQTLFQQGEPGDFMVVILSGCVRVCLFSAAGREITLNLIEAGEALGEIAALDGRRRTADAVATDRVEALVIRRADILDTLRARPELCLRLMEVLCSRLRRTSGQVEALALHDLTGRLAMLLLRLADEYGAPDDAGGVRIGRRLPQGDIARLIGCTRESVNRQLRAWSAEGLVEIVDGALSLRDPEALRAMLE